METEVKRNVDELKSPLRKLVQFFQRSRDNWKRKCQERKRRCVALSNQLRAVEASRSRWKGIAQEQRLEAQRLRQQVEALKSRRHPSPEWCRES
jgi:hypothetical protein